MAEQFPPLSAATLAAANQVGAWLAQDDLATLPALPQVDVVVLAGNAVIPTIDAACRLAAEREVPLLVSGGVGHSTNYLYEAVRQDTRYRMLPVVGRPEAHVLADIAHDYWQIPRSRLVVEDQSTNCGENARFTRTTLENGGIPHRRGIVIQDPTMQRRTMATFARVWQGVTTPPQWLSFPGCSPVLEQTDGQLGFAGGGAGLWPSCRACRIRLKDTVRGGKTSSATSPSRRRSSMPGDSCGRTPSLPGRCRPAPSAENCPFAADLSQTGNLCYWNVTSSGHFWPGFMNQLTEQRQRAAKPRLIRPIFNKKITC